MKSICPTCRIEITDASLKRCPRCNSILQDMKKCESCDGCSIFKKKGNNKC